MKALKSIVPLALLLLSALVYTGCEKEDLNIAPKQFGPEFGERAVYLKGSRAEKAIRLLKANMEYSHVGIASQNNAHMRTGTGWTIDFSEILLINDTLGNHNYTYRVNHPDSSKDVFYNLVLTENSAKTTIKLVKYKMSQKFYDGYSRGEMELTRFGGTITFTPILKDELPEFDPEEPGEPQNPEEPVNPCEEEVVIEIPDYKPGGGGSGSNPTPGLNNYQPQPEAITPQQPSCWFWAEIPCNGGEGHVGNDPTCTGSFKGATFLYNRCTGSTTQIYSMTDELPVVTDDPCEPVGDIGVLGPLPHIIISQELRENFECQTSIIQDAYGVCSDLNNAFLTVFESSDTHNITYTHSPILSPLKNAQTAFVSDGFNPDGTQYFNFSITFRDDFLNQATDMMVAAVTIHENLHATLYYLKRTNIIYTMNENPTYDQLLACYYEKLVEIGNMPFMPNGFQHDFMTQFIDDIADTLQAYGNNKGYNLPYSYYKALAWSGLHETPIFAAIYPETDSEGYINPENEYILGTIIAEQANAPAIDNNGSPYLDLSGNPIVPLSQKCAN